MTTNNFGVLSQLAADASRPSRMTVINPDTEQALRDGNGEECWIEFLSIDSEAGRKIERLRQGTLLRRMRSGRTRLEDEDPIEYQADMLTALCTGWNLGSEARFSSGAARDLFSSPEFGWLRRQCWVYVGSEANFIRRSSRTSSSSPSTSSASDDSEQTEHPSESTWSQPDSR
jgi:hypothetical protein